MIIMYFVYCIIYHLYESLSGPTYVDGCSCLFNLLSLKKSLGGSTCGGIVFYSTYVGPTYTI
jgi:hypothetical protein